MNTDTELPPVSLIICSRGRPGMLVQTVKSILDCDEVPSELIVIDQSSDENRELATMRSGRCELRYRHMNRVGVSFGRNVGVRMARHEILVFTDDDVFVARSWLGSIVRALVAEGKGSVVTGRVLAGAPEQPGAFMWDTNDRPHRQVFEGRIDTDPLYPTNMALYRASIEAVGLYDERLGPGTPFPAAEDNDLAFRLLEGGYRIVYVPDPVVTHRAWRPPEEYLRLRWRYSYGQGAYLGKHVSLRDRHMLVRLARAIGRHSRWCVQNSLRPLDPQARRQGYAGARSAVGLALGAFNWIVSNRTPPTVHSPSAPPTHPRQRE